MKPWDERVYDAIAIKRSALFKPIARILSACGVSPDIVSFAGIAAMLGVVYNLAIWQYSGDTPIIPKLTLWWLLAVFLLDETDGAIARYRRAESDRGKFVDVAVDTTTYAIFVAGLAHAGLIGIFTGVALAYFATISRVLMVIRKNLHRRDSDWHFFSGSGPFVTTLTYSTYAIFALDALVKADYLRGLSGVILLLFVLKSARDFYLIRYKNH